MHELNVQRWLTVCHPIPQLGVLLLIGLIGGCQSPTPVTQQPSTATPRVSSSASARTTPQPTPAAKPIPTFPVNSSGKRISGGQQAVLGEQGMVVSVEAQATRAGVEILRQGGNAVDAAVAVGYALAVTHPSAGNLGGGGFLLVRPSSQKTVAIDFREKAPIELTQDYFDKMIQNGARGPAASGVPGAVAGLNLAQRRFGKLTLREVLAPAIRLAQQGHRVGARQALTLRWAWPILRKDKAARAIFSDNKSPPRPYKKGDRIHRSDLLKTLQRIAAQGDAGFYSGETARLITQAMKRSTGQSGLITLQDLKSYRAVERRPIHLNYRGFEVEIMPPPSAGGVAIAQLLTMLEKLNAHRHSAQSPKMLHLFIEASKRAHAEKRFAVGDPDSGGHDDSVARQRWLDPNHWLLRKPIDLKQVTPSANIHELYPAASAELEQTTHFSTVDALGNVVSCTMTLSAGFGAKYVVPGTGIVMNNTLAAFGTVGANRPRPGRRMTSSMSPTLVLRGNQPLLILGSPGGDTIPSTVVQVLRNIIDYGMNLDEAIEYPRIHHGFVPDEVRFERARSPQKSALRTLQSMGHRLSRKRIAIGDANNILIDGSIAWGYADSREGGLALGLRSGSSPKSPVTNPSSTK